MIQPLATTKHNQYAEALYLDLEWTCWNSPPPLGMKQEIIEIGIVVMDLNELRMLDEASYFVRPCRWEISQKCTDLTGITDQDIRNARPFAEVLQDLLKRFHPKERPCCTWGDDMPVLARACSSVGQMNPFRRSIDLSRVFQGAFAIKENVGLRTATEMLAMTFDGIPHGALPDARNTAMVHAAILRRLRLEPEPRDPSPIVQEAIGSLSSFAQKLSECLKE